MSIQPKSIGSTTLVCKDVDITKTFYEQKLGLRQIADDTDDLVKFYLGDSELVLFPQPDNISATSFSQQDVPDLTINTELNINDIVTLLGNEAILLLKGPISIIVDGEKYQSVFLRDPDQHLIEIRSDDLVSLDTLDKHPEKGMSVEDTDFIET